MTGDTTAATDGTGERRQPEKELTIQWIVDSAYAERHVLRGPRLRIGRGPECHIRLDHPLVSREHAELQRQGPIYALSDLGSRNGTHLNGERTEHAVLSDGDVVRVGAYVGVVRARARLEEEQPFSELAPGLFGGPTLGLALKTLKTSAATDIPVVIVGETGTGKELVARAIHHFSARAGRFHALNCSTLPVDLAEAELFGHQRGAYTGAERARTGHLRAADRGTLFLDEVADLPLAIQAKLLRAIEQREVIALGDTDATPIDVRIVVAAHEPLEHYVQRGSFRADLAQRLAGFRFELPPLRSRLEEVPGLFLRFFERHADGQRPKVDEKLLERLCLYGWPGNVREIELFTRKLLGLHANEDVLRREFSDALLPMTASRCSALRAGNERSSDRREYDLGRLQAALAENEGNLSAAAASIGISRRRAYRVLEKLPNSNGASAKPREEQD
jgi:DNA-binding NtrC family response regulator